MDFDGYTSVDPLWHGPTRECDLPGTQGTSTSTQFNSPIQEHAPCWLPSGSSLSNSPRDPYSHPWSIPGDQALTEVGRVEDYSAVLLGRQTSSNSDNSDPACASIYPTQDGSTWIPQDLNCDLGFLTTEHPVINGIPWAGGEVVDYAVSSTSTTACETNPGPPISSMDEYIERCFQSIDPYTPPRMDVSPPKQGVEQPQTYLSVEDALIFCDADLAVGIYRSPDALKNLQGVDPPANCAHSARTQPNQDFEDAHTPSSIVSLIGRQVVSSQKTTGLCGWRGANREKCGVALTRANVPDHLSSAHGIEDMARDHRIMCGWIDCKRKKPMNRESIVRHTRETHLHLKRPPSKRRDTTI